MKTRWAMWLPLAAFAVLAALVLHGLLRPASTEVASAMIGKPLPAIALPQAVEDRPALDLGTVPDGGPRLLNVFASWCVPCTVEAPVLGAIAAEGVAIDGIAIRDRREDLTAWLARNGNPYARIGSDAVSAVQLAIGSSGVPETFVIDGSGVIRYQHIGPVMERDRLTLLSQLRKAEEPL